MSTIKLDDLLAETPYQKDGGDLRDYELDSVDGFLLSRIDGNTQAAMLAEMIGLSRFDLAHRLLRLASLGLVEWGAGGTRDSNSKWGKEEQRVAQTRATIDSQTLRGGNKKSDAVVCAQPFFTELEEECELELEEKRRILVAYKNLDILSHWEILGADGESSSAEIKQAYFRISKIFHPDRFFGRELGNYKQRLHRVFMAVKQAYRVLEKPASRANYRANYPPRHDIPENRLLLYIAPETSTKSADIREIAAERRLEGRRKEIKAQRRNHRVAKAAVSSDATAQGAKPHFEQGLALLHDGKLDDAAECFKMASVLRPSETKYRMLYEDTLLQANTNKARILVSKAYELEEDREFKEAGKCFAKAADLMPTMASYAVNAAQAYLKAGEAKIAVEYAERGVSISPNRKEVRLVAAAAQQANSDSLKARRHLQVVMSLDAKDDRAKELMKQLEKALEK